ncbi:unnamed protein product [Didymodactylos carnosus]|uniref:Uncharacterized protein n=1 Tax=Didymodactylos carnosus TaxID=1234261 RepID=A0A8S2FIE2_9BILA|nr:unnamed protein product [Didymodactylos carnosus]CAF4257083.1 unnamed protein product [Didymodactylos carnosus]
MCLVSKVSVEKQDDEIQCLIDNLAQEYRNALFPPTSEIDLSSNVAPVDVYSTIPEHEQDARQENESIVLTNIDQILTKTSVNVNSFRANFSIKKQLKSIKTRKDKINVIRIVRADNRNIPAKSNAVVQISNLRANFSKQHVEHFMAENSQLAAQYIAVFASNENGSAVDLSIVLFTMNPSPAAAVLDIFELLAAAANCNRSITKMGSIKSPAHAGPNITNEDLYPLFTLDAKRSDPSQKRRNIDN